MLKIMFMNENKDNKTDYRAVRERLKPIVGQEQKLQPPEIKEWFQITPAEVKDLKKYVEQVYQTTKNQNSVGLNDEEKKTLDQHLEIMNQYFQVLWQYPDFRNYFNKHGISQEFHAALVQLHDFSRYLFNGQFPLRYTDCVSDGLVGRLFPEFPRAFLHSIAWLTGEKEPPNVEILENLPQNPAQVCGLVLKAVDTLGKIEPDRKLRNPSDFFAPNNGYGRWLSDQEAKGRFPFPVLIPSPNGRIRREVKAADYAQKDQWLTNLGIKAIEQLTGGSFAQIQKQVQERLTVNEALV